MSVKWFGWKLFVCPVLYEKEEEEDHEEVNAMQKRNARKIGRWGVKEGRGASGRWWRSRGAFCHWSLRFYVSIQTRVGHEIRLNGDEEREESLVTKRRCWSSIPVATEKEDALDPVWRRMFLVSGWTRCALTFSPFLILGCRSVVALFAPCFVISSSSGTLFFIDKKRRERERHMLSFCRTEGRRMKRQQTTLSFMIT